QRRVRGELVAHAAGGAVAGTGVVPESAAGASYVPVGYVVDEPLDLTAGVRGVVGVQVDGHARHQAVQAREHPAVGRWAGGRRRGVDRVHVVDVGVSNEERVRVPQGEDEAPHDVLDG